MTDELTDQIIKSVQINTEFKTVEEMLDWFNRTLETKAQNTLLFLRYLYLFNDLEGINDGQDHISDKKVQELRNESIFEGDKSFL